MTIYKRGAAFFEPKELYRRLTAAFYMEFEQYGINSQTIAVYQKQTYSFLSHFFTVLMNKSFILNDLFIF